MYATGRVLPVRLARQGLFGHVTSGFYFLQVAKGHTGFAEFDPVNQIDNAEFVEVAVS